MNNIKVFENSEFGAVRTLDLDGKPYFVASDIAKALGYAKPQNAVSAHCRGALKQGIGVQTGIKTDGEPAFQTIEMLVIPEGDVYRLVTHSKLPSAVRFEGWVFDEVLPSIRKNGGYISGQDTMSDDELLAKALLVAQNKIAERDKQIAEQGKQIEEMKPSKVFADAVATSKTSILIGELAKILKQNGIETGEKRLFAWLRSKGYLISRKGTDYNAPTQKSMELKLFEVKETAITHADGHVTIQRTTKVTGKGQQYFINKFLSEKTA